MRVLQRGDVAAEVAAGGMIYHRGEIIRCSAVIKPALAIHLATTAPVVPGQNTPAGFGKRAHQPAHIGPLAVAL